MPPRTAMIVGGASLAAGLAYLWWRKKQGSSPGSGSSSPTGCTDSSGNSVPCPDSAGVDTAGQLSVIQTELESLLAEKEDTDSDEESDADDKGKPGSPGSLKVTSATSSGFKASWSKPTTGGTATSYTYDIETGGKLVKSATTMGTSITATGLKKSTSYTFFIRACNHSGCSASVSATIKTSA